MKKEQDRCRYFMDNGTQCPKTKTLDSQFCEQHANWLVADLEVYRVITNHFRQDVREFWVRSNFYLLVQAGLLSVFATGIISSTNYDKAIAMSLGILGLIIAISWFLVSRGQ